MVEYLLIALVFSNILQFVFWSRQNTRLVDKIMSRNYADYVQSQAVSQPVVRKPEVEDLQIEDADILRELNRAIPS